MNAVTVIKSCGLNVLCLMVFLLVSPCNLWPQEQHDGENSSEQSENEESDDNTRYLKVDTSSPNAVVLDGTDFFEQQPLGRLINNQPVVLLGEEDGEYVKIKAVIKGKEVEGWIKKTALAKEPIQHKPRASESSSVPAAAIAAKASVGRIEFDDDNPWQHIDPTSADAKLKGSPVPYHLIVPAGIIVVGGGALVLALANKDSEPDPEPPVDDPIIKDPEFVLLNDSYSVLCGQSLLIYPLQNDVGTGLVITGINNAPDGVELLNESTISIPASLSGDVIFTVNVEDAVGQTGISEVSISVEQVDIVANSDSYALNQGEVANGNVLDNDLCFGCEVVDASGGIGTLVIDPNGDFQFFSPEDFWGEVVYTITIQNPCGAEDTSELVFIISPTDCDLVLVDDTAWVNAGETVDGNVLDNDMCTGCVVTAISDAEGTMEWDAEGNFSYTAPGNFEGQVVFVVSVTDACDQEGTQNLVIIVENPPCAFEWTGQVETIPADCGLDNGGAFATEELFGPYNFSWSNGVDVPENEDIPAGTYQLFVTDTTTGCIDTLVAEIEELAPNYMLDAIVDPGTCGAVDGVLLNSNASEDNPLTIIVSGASSGSIDGVITSPLNLGDFVALNAGNLTISVYSDAAGSDCAEEIQLVLEQSQLPDFILNDDVVEVDAGEMVTGNFLDNDICNGCTVQSVSVADGELDWQPNGDYNYTAPDENGEVVFIVSVTDACGQEGNQSLTFIVQVPDPCGFDWNGTIETVSADCGLSNGSAVATGDVADYVFTWTNGIEGLENDNLPAGEIQLVVNDPGSGCSDTLVAIIDELAPNYFLDVEIVPGECGATDNVLLFSNASPDSPVTIDLSGSTSGTFAGNSDSPVDLSSLVPLNPGEMIITVWADDAGPECSQTIEVTLNQAPTPEIIVMDTGPDFAVLDILNAVFPVDVFVNGAFHVSANESPAFIEGLPPGMNEIFIVDATGCMSPIIVVDLDKGGGIYDKNLTSLRWSPQNQSSTNWINTPQHILLNTHEGTDAFYPVGTPASFPLIIGLERGNWVASFAFASSSFQQEGVTPSQFRRINYSEWSVGNRIDIFGKNATIAVGYAQWRSNSGNDRNTSGWFSDALTTGPVKGINAQLQVGLRVGVINGFQELIVLPKIQCTFSK